eukprot:gene7207-8013_t
MNTAVVAAGSGACRRKPTNSAKKSKKKDKEETKEKTSDRNPYQQPVPSQERHPTVSQDSSKHTSHK